MSVATFYVDLPQLFDEDNPLHKFASKYIFTTEGHVVPIDPRFRQKSWEEHVPCKEFTKEPPANISNVSIQCVKMFIKCCGFFVNMHVCSLAKVHKPQISAVDCNSALER